MTRFAPYLIVLSAISLMTAPAAAQEARGVAPAELAYEREVYTYPSGARPDPFRSLLRDGDLGMRVEDLRLRGIVHHQNPAQSVAMLTIQGTDRRVQARVGDIVGPLRVLAIHPDRVEIVVEELGVARRETLRIARPESGGSNP